MSFASRSFKGSPRIPKLSMARQGLGACGSGEPYAKDPSKSKPSSAFCKSSLKNERELHKAKKKEWDGTYSEVFNSMTVGSRVSAGFLVTLWSLRNLFTFNRTRQF